MTKIKLHTRSFHPDANFGSGGLGFKGDNRGFKDAEKVTSRIKHYFYINLKTQDVEGIVCESDPSENTVIPAILDAGVVGAKIAIPPIRRVPVPPAPPMQNDYKEARKQPRKDMPTKSITAYRDDGDQTVRVIFWYAGQNFAFYGANTDTGHSVYSTVVPDLDVTHDFSLRIDRTNKKALMTSAIGGDGFPNCESFMMDPGDATCIIGTHVRIGTAMTQLPSGRLLPMTKTSYELEWNDGDKFGSAMDIHTANDFTGDGSPHEIAPSGGTSRSAWNAVHLGRDASGDWLRQIEDHVPTGRQTWRQVKDKFNEIGSEIGRELEKLGKPRF
jgi:hypothetical protein